MNAAKLFFSTWTLRHWIAFGTWAVGIVLVVCFDVFRGKIDNAILEAILNSVLFVAAARLGYKRALGI